MYLIFIYYDRLFRYFSFNYLYFFINSFIGIFILSSIYMIDLEWKSYQLCTNMHFHIYINDIPYYIHGITFN